MKLLNAVSPLHVNIQVAKFQICWCMFHQHQVWVKSVACSPSPIADNPSALPYPPPPINNSSCLLTRHQTQWASSCTALLYFPRFFTVRLKVFCFCVCLLMYNLCEKYYKPITAQYYIGNCGSWVHRLTLLSFQANWTCECTLGMELICMYRTCYVL